MDTLIITDFPLDHTLLNKNWKSFQVKFSTRLENLFYIQVLVNSSIHKHVYSTRALRLYYLNKVHVKTSDRYLQTQIFPIIIPC